MTYNKYLVIASKQDPAGVNIVNQLSQYKENPVLDAMKNKPGFDIYMTEKNILHEENLDLDKINQYDFVIFASKHATNSENPQKTLSIHAPGNFRDAREGGKDRKLSVSSALVQKSLFEILNQKAKEHKLDEKYRITLEATHHGPLIDKPCLFIEIGSAIDAWKDSKAGFVIARTIKEFIDNFEENPYREIAIGIGGPHYCPNFNKIQLKSNHALSHIIPQYVLPLTPEIIKEALDKTEEEIDLAIIDWKGIPNSEERQRIIDILEKMYVRWEKTSNIKK